MDNILYREEKYVAVITLNRPKVYNALGKDDKFLIRQMIKKANRSSDIRSIVITGEGKAFCTGQDLGDRSVQKNVDLGHTLNTEWNPLITAIRDSSKIIISAIQGLCAGAGIALGLGCDLVVAHPKATFIAGFSKLGLAPDAGCSALFVETLGYRKTLEFFLLSNSLDPSELLQRGAVNSLSENTVQTALSWGEKLGQFPLKTMTAIKRNLHRAMDTDFIESLKGETCTQRYLGNSPEYQEGLKAFIEKRPPVFYPNNVGDR